MGQKDLSEKNLEYFPDVFADIINALLYEGEPVIEPDSLVAAPTETLYYSQFGNLRNQFNDVSKYQMQDGTIHLQYTLENETKANRRMIFRRVGYEGAVYREQLDRRETFPFIGLILYWGRRKWHHPRSVTEYFSERKIPLETWKYINNFRMPVFQMARLPGDVRSRFTSDMRIIVDYLAEGENYIPTNQPIRHVEAFMLMMKNITGDEKYEELIPLLLENEEEEGEEITMVNLFDKYWNMGVTEGISQGISQGFSQGTTRGASQMLVKNVDSLIRNLSMSLAQACESIGSSIEEYQNAKKTIAQTTPTEV